MDYQEIKQLAKEGGQSVTDLIALAPQNDPFYCGSKGQVAKAEWFVAQVERFGHDANGKCHLRRLHYAMMSVSATKANGELYENTKTDWGYLMNAGKYARYLGLVSPDIFLDIRNKDAAQEFAPSWSEAPRFYQQTWKDTDITTPIFPDVPGFETESGQARQDYHLEIWVEKSTMNDILVPICRKHGVNLVAGMGELSISAVRSFLKRARRADKPVAILYIADFDPAGFRMPVSIARKIEYFAQEEYGLDVTLQPIVLTQAQVDKYQLPPMPFKNAANANKARNLAAFSDYAVELDAMEALHPGALGVIVSGEIERYIDKKLDAKHDAVYQAMCDTVNERRDDALEPFADDWEYLQAHCENARRDFEQAIAPVREHLPGMIVAIKGVLSEIEDDEYLTEEIQDGLGDDIADFDFVDSESLALKPELGEPYSSPLFSTDRDYMDQLEIYNAYNDGDL